MYSLLSPGGVFISLHEPSLISTVIEGAKLLAYPIALLAPGWVNDIARERYTGEPSSTDIWMFDPKKLRKVALESGFSRVDIYPWHLLRQIFVQKFNLHLSEKKQNLTDSEEYKLKSAVLIDSYANRILPIRCFGSICLVCHQ